MNRNQNRKRFDSALQALPTLSAKRLQVLAVALFLILGWSMVAVQVFAATPGGPAITYIGNESYSGYGTGTDPGTYPGGVIATLNLNAIQVNENWKGFAGNITGGLSLADTEGNRLYNWSQSIRGQVYVTRVQTITWANLGCANAENISLEEGVMEHNDTNTGGTNISFTFALGTHPGFTAADVGFVADQCTYSLYTNQDNEAGPGGSDGNWSEVLLASGTDIIYTTLINDSMVGFDGSASDYQLIVAENGTLAGKPHSTLYYFFVELT